MLPPRSALWQTDWSVSEPMAAYRLSRTGWIETEIYRELMADYAVRWQHQRQRQREQNRNSESGPERTCHQTQQAR